MENGFDKRRVYKEQIEAKVIELKQLCHMQKIPMFITLCLGDDGKETFYEKEMVSPMTCNYKITDDQIAKHVNVTLGFDTIQPSSEIMLDMDEIEVNYIKESEEGENEDE